MPPLSRKARKLKINAPKVSSEMHEKCVQFVAELALHATLVLQWYDNVYGGGAQPLCFKSGRVRGSIFTTALIFFHVYSTRKVPLLQILVTFYRHPSAAKIENYLVSRWSSLWITNLEMWSNVTIEIFKKVHIFFKVHKVFINVHDRLTI